MYASVGYLMPVLANLHWCPSLPACLNSGGYMEISILHLSQRCPYFRG